ncbi:MAG: ROK family protein [Candidatus Aminicenantes bacterium]|nr:ROK family protein [Candidatus Aminicenantes bacterium]TFG58539.1 MAG: ROK family protein [Candidatus Aminicenantes bacterium]
MSDPAVIGVDLGGTNVRAGRVERGRLADVKSVAVRSQGSERDVLEDMFGAIDAVMRKDVAGIGAGVPSVIDLKAGIVYDVQNIRSWKKVPLKARLEERYGLPAYVNNDANCFAAGEKYFGKAKPFDHAVGLILGTGLGAGVIANGRLYSGVNCGAGEFGMLPYLDRNFEAYASGQFFERVHGVSGRELSGRAEQGDERALAIFAEFGGHLGEAVKAICYAVDPEVIVLGGSVSRSARFFQAAMWDAFQSFAYSITKERLKIEVSETENIAILGAAALYYDALAK